MQYAQSQSHEFVHVQCKRGCVFRIIFEKHIEMKRANKREKERERWNPTHLHVQWRWTISFHSLFPFPIVKIFSGEWWMVNSNAINYEIWVWFYGLYVFEFFIYHSWTSPSPVQCSPVQWSFFSSWCWVWTLKSEGVQLFNVQQTKAKTTEIQIQILNQI